MARIFISHSSQNNAAAIALSDWLVGAGWDDLFLDLDPERGIAAGERWERALNQAANRCEAVVFLVSGAWLASAWCRKELHLADKLNKRLFGVLIEDIPTAKVPGEIRQHFQLVNLASGRDHKVFRAELPDGHEEHVTFSMSGLARLRAGLTQAGLDPKFFAWPPENDADRPPYRGLSPLEAEDAGIFFGREAPTVEVLDRLRGFSEAAPPRLFVILGASGAGKSSFLRAGLLPRLQRDDRHFLPLPVVRPERAALTGESGFVRSLQAALKRAELKRSLAEVKAAVHAGAQQIRALLDELAEQGRRPAVADEGRLPAPKLVLPIDQGEELFLSEGAEEAEAFLELIRSLTLDPASNLIILFTVRSDSFESLQTAKQLDGVTAHTFSLPPLARGAYQTVIEGPAARLHGTNRALTIEPALTAALLADIEGGGKDALPLLAFTLERLYLEHGGDGDLKLAEYQAIGGIRGSIEAAVENALKGADSDPAVPRDRTARLALLRRALIPWLAGIDPATGSPRRRISMLLEIPDEARPLVDHLIAARLLSTDVSPESGERTVEPAHEALLRQWGLLEGWLKEESAPLSILDGVKRAAGEWEANNRNEDWLAHSAGRLEDAEAVRAREDFAGMIGTSERAYLDACRAAETARRERELEATRRRIRLQRRLVLVSSFAAVVFAVIGGWAWIERTRAEAETVRAEAETARAEAQTQVAEKAREETTATLKESRTSTSRFLADLARQRMKESRLDDAIALARHAMPFEVRDWPTVRTAENALALAMQSYAAAIVVPTAVLVGHKGTVRGGAFSADGDQLLTWSYDGTARLWDVATGGQLEVLQHDGAIKGGLINSDGRHVLTWSFDGTVRYWKVGSGERPITCSHDDVVVSAVLSDDETRVLSWSYDGTARIWDTKSGLQLALLRHRDVILEARFFDEGNKVLTFSFDGSAGIWSSPGGIPLGTFNHASESDLGSSASAVRGAVLFGGERRVLTWSYDGTIRTWETATARQLRLMDHKEVVGGALLFTDEKSVVTWAGKRALLWDVETGRHLRDFSHDATVAGATVSKDRQHLLTWAADRTLHLWNIADGKRLAWTSHAEHIIGARFSPKDDAILSWSYDSTAQYWREPAGTNPRRIVLQHEGVVRNAVFSGDGLWAWTRSDDGTARLWGLPNGRLSATLRHQGEVFAIIPSPKNLIATVSADGTARLWDLGRVRFIELKHDAKVNGAFFSKDGSRLLSWSADGSARLWDSANGKSIFVLRHNHDVAGAGFSLDGNAVFTWSADRTIRIWDSQTGTETIRIQSKAKPQGVVYSSVNSRLLGWFEGGGATLWDSVSGKAITEFSDMAGRVGASFSPDSGRALLWSSDGAIRVFDSRDGNELKLFDHEKLAGAMFSSDNASVLSWSDDGTLRIWDLARNTMTVEMRDEASVIGAALSPDGKNVLSWADNVYGAKIWDAETGAILSTLPHGQFPLGGFFGPDGRAWTWSSSDLYAWDAETGQEVFRINAGDGLARSSLVAQGDLILTSSMSEDRLWDTQTGDLVGSVPSLPEKTVSSEGRRLATWSNGGSIVQIWQLRYPVEELGNQSAKLVERLRPLSVVERCQAYLERTGCEIISKTTERDVALVGDAHPLTGKLFSNEAPGEGAHRVEAKIKVEIVVNDRSEVMIFHNKPFHAAMKRVEIDRITGRLDFRFAGGVTRTFGIPMHPEIQRYAEYADRILLVLIDEKTGEPIEGQYFPLLVY